ncbi:MAG: helix-turn-helix domain-containing protein [Opitutaceae bacterium]|nr:helix-turn-helix domain-containing protein [Opitutaceae bacterium]
MSPVWKETTVDGPRTRRWSLDRGQCAELATHRIAWLGLDTVAAPYRRVRLAPSGSFLLACLEGEGRIFLEGRWQVVRPGQLCLAPPRILNAFHAVARRKWTFAWIRYEEPLAVQPLVHSRSPLRVGDGAREIGRVVSGLKDEWEGVRSAAMIHHWISLLHGLNLRVAQPARAKSRLSALWERVSMAIAEDWKLSSLAAEAGVSAEHLRRMCRKQLGRTPMAQVASMRIQRAQELLHGTDDKLDAIAPQVGYHTADVFIRAFTRTVGLTPTQYRERGREARNTAGRD